MSRGGIIRSSRQTRQSIAQSDPLSVQCQYIANPMSIHCQSDANPMPILCQSTANLIPINCQSNFNSVPIRFQSNQINPRLPTSHHSGTNPLTIQSVQCQSASPEPIHQSNVHSVLICQSITSLPIQDKSANPSPICQSITYIQSMPICQSITNPHIIGRSMANHTVQCQSNPSPIHQNNS